jgi:outer membrane protein assembly factor BamB
MPKRILLAALGACVLAPGAIARESSGLAAAGTIALGPIQGRIDHLAVDVGGRRLFVAALGNDSVEAIDVERGRVIGRITGLHHPQGLAFLPQQNRLVVANADDPVVRFYDATLLKPASQVTLGEDCDNVRVDQTASRVYVGYGDGAIAALDAGDAHKIDETAVGGHPESFQLERHGSRLFVNVPARQEVIAIDRAAQKIVAHWKLAAAANYPMALDEQHGRLFVGCRRPARLITLDTSTGAAIAEIDTVGDTDDLFYDAAANRVYVIGGAGAIQIVDVSGTPRPIGRVDTRSGARTGLFVPELQRLFVAAPARGARPAALLVYNATR